MIKILFCIVCTSLFIIPVLKNIFNFSDKIKEKNPVIKDKIKTIIVLK
jgi:hypothetical protein